MNIRFNIKFYDEDLHLFFKYRFFKYKKRLRYEDLVTNKSKKKNVKKKKKKKKRKNIVENLKELLITIKDLQGIGKIKWMKIGENGILNSKFYFFYYSFVFLFLNNVFIYLNKNQKPLIYIEGVYKLNLRKGGLVLWKKLKKYLKS